MADKLGFTGDPKVIVTMRNAQVFEAQLNLQYRLDERLLKFMGTKKLANKFASFGDDAHEWLSAVTKQVLFLGGDAGYKVPPITSPDTVTDVISEALALEMATVEPYEQAIEIARVAFDDASRNLFEHLRKWHNGHILWLSQQLRLIDGLTEPNYIAQKL